MILVTGGAGYIGSHACVALLSAGEDVVVLDNFCNSSPLALERIQQICGKRPTVVEADIRDQSAIEEVLVQHGCTAVMHFAGLKSVQDSVAQPLEYYDQNVIGSHRLLRAMQKTGVKKIVFSSSATVYGTPKFLPYTEDHPLNAINPYGRTKLMIEDMLRDQYTSDPTWAVAILRYFNPVGAHESGLIGEDPKGVPNNLVPFVAQVAIGRRERLSVWGGDYDTPDGTGVRDYIHVMDLADGHVSALSLLSSPKCFAVNLGTGAGSSVIEVIRAFEAASGKQIPYDIKPRRAGDLAAYYAATDYATKLLGWKATRSLETMCADHWRWQSSNPNGYA
ncbi:UDP-glucose 4-epimerase GalE [Bradyrhizobium sp. CCBAU 51753]|uniref:UDP-glucose 4-epimerase GalE n=1 Tax=Bradyrhizobium sp. CCBAU 51753 TaxID=1325100 RepID=UPI00188C9B98|nr:UDP-glucose 4-epimerase GalE [Bradyrhizobium sp. CCBAU 51753]QOZ24917.1 UDP-glucose 4-epimerase GalE [Bradyrhizobium sp. CCBAU 51753]